EWSPAAGQHGLSCADEVVGSAEPRSIVEGPVREPRERFTRILLVVIKATTHCTGVQGGIPYGKAIPLTVVPCSEMRRTQTVFHGQSPCHPPAIHAEELDRIISLIMQIAEIRLLILTGEASKQIRIGITAATTGPPSFHKQTI